MNALIYVTIPTGTPIWSSPSADHGQPHIVQLAAMILDVEKEEMLEQKTWNVKPEGWEIPEEVQDDIGVNLDQKLYEGVVLNGFYRMWRECDIRVSYGESYHSRIIRIAMKRYMAESVITEWKEGSKTSICAMRASTDVLKIPQTVGRGKYKFPKLGEAYMYFADRTLPDKTSIEDRLDACRAIYFGLMDIRS